MTLDQLISELQSHAQKYPDEWDAIQAIIDWIEKYREFAFVKENLAWHITASMMITNPKKTKTLLMLHKKFQRWQQFGGHCDGEIDVKNVALREFHEESGIMVDPIIFGDIFLADVHSISVDKKWTPPHKHFDIMFLGVIPEDTQFSRQESEVDDIRWFDIDQIENQIDRNMSEKIHKIQKFISFLWN